MLKWARLLFVVVACSLVGGSYTPEVQATSITVGRMLALELVYCPDAHVCVMNVKGNNTVLGRQVAVRIGNYQAPSAAYPSCRLERRKGIRAARFLTETLRNAEHIFLVDIKKRPRDPFLSGTLMVDGEDITTLMFGMQLAVPRGVKVDWCEGIGRKFEV